MMIIALNYQYPLRFIVIKSIDILNTRRTVMKALLICLSLLMVCSAIGLGQDKIDVVYLKNGDVRKGTIIENVPNNYVKLETIDGSIYTIKYADVEKITKEKSPIKSFTKEAPQGLMARTHDIGVTAALWMSGGIYISRTGAEPDKDAGLLLRVFYDEYVMEKLGVGLYVNYSSVSSEASTSSATMLEIGGAFKPRFPLSNGAAVLKLGLNIGYRLYSSDIEYMDEINALGLNMTAEVQFRSSAKIVPFVEVGFLSQAVGGNSYTDITFPPIIYFGGGIVF